MDLRRLPRTVIDPKVRQVGFFTPGDPPPSRTASEPPIAACSTSPPAADLSTGSSLSPVMIPPPRPTSSDGLSSGSLPVPYMSPLRRDSLNVGSYSPSESIGSFFTAGMINGASELDEETTASVRVSWSGSGKAAAASFPVSRGKMMAMNVGGNLRADAMEYPLMVSDEGGALIETNADEVELSTPAKQKPTKAERRALQEAQRASKNQLEDKDVGGSSETHAEGAEVGRPEKQKPTKAERRALQEAQRAAKNQLKDGSKAVRPPPQKKDTTQATATTTTSEKKGAERLPEKDRKKDAPHPRMQFDDKNRVEKAKRRSVVNQYETRNRVELFRHLPQYVHGTLLPDLESKFFQLDPMHPSVYKVGLQYLTGKISGGNARCIAMLLAFKEAIGDYRTPSKKVLARDLAAKVSSYVSFLIECRPLSVSMGNAIKFLKYRIAKLPLNLSEAEAKSSLQSDIDRFINEKIVIADKNIVRHAVTKIRDGDVVLTYGSSCAVEMILVSAHELGKQFRVVVVDSRPKLEGQALLRKLVAKGIECTYTHINAISYIMHEVTRALLGASAVLSNGTVYSRVGTACVAMVSHAFRVPVLICCEAYKFHERVQLDSICFNELGDPDVISKICGRKELNYLDKWENNENLQLLNLSYDATPSDYVSAIVTDYGMLPPTSVPVIVREYRRENLWL